MKWDESDDWFLAAGGLWFLGCGVAVVQTQIGLDFPIWLLPNLSGWICLALKNHFTIKEIKKEIREISIKNGWEPVE